MDSKIKQESTRVHTKVMGSDFYEGKIKHIGYDRNGITDIEFVVDNGSGYSSYWEDWTHEAVKIALKYNKKIQVYANGEPTGTNITDIKVYSDIV